MRKKEVNILADGEQVLSTTISATAQLTAEAMKILASAIRKLIYESVIEEFKLRTRADYRLQKEQFNELKKELNHEKIRSSVGYVNERKLKESGVPTAPTGVYLTKKEMQELANMCKKNDVIITGVRTDFNKDGQALYFLEVRESDLQKLSDILDIMNIDRKLDRIEQGIKDVQQESNKLQKELYLLDKKGQLTPDEELRRTEIIDKLAENKEVVKGLSAQIRNVEAEKFESYNKLRQDAVYQKVVTNQGKVKLEKEPITFNEAVDRITDKQLKRNTTFYVADMKNPDNYIKCEARNAEFEGKKYIKTDYTVYRNGEEVLKRDDGRYEGKTYKQWFETRAELKNAGDFSDSVLRFSTIDELNNYRSQCRQMNVELNDLKQGQPNRNYDKIIQELNEKIKSNGYVYRDGTAFEKDTGKKAEINSAMRISKKAQVAEVVIIAKQIENYTELRRVESELNLARVKEMTVSDVMPQHEEIKAEVSKLETEYNELLKTEVSLIEERKELNSAKAVDLSKESVEQQREDISIDDIKQSVDEQVIDVSFDGVDLEETEQRVTAESTRLKAETSKGDTAISAEKHEMTR